MRDQFEAGDSVQFTFTTSVQPDAAPYLAVFSGGVFASGTLVNSQTAQTSGPLAYYAMFTMPASSDGIYGLEWGAQKTVAGTPFPFKKRNLFVVQRTREPGT